SRGSRACSTEAKNASMSRCTTEGESPARGARSAIEHHRRDAPRELVCVEAQLVDVARLDRAGEVVQGLETDAVLPARVDAHDAVALGAAPEHDRRGLAPREVRPHADRLVQLLDAHEQVSEPRQGGATEEDAPTLLHKCAVVKQPRRARVFSY